MLDLYCVFISSSVWSGLCYFLCMFIEIRYTEGVSLLLCAAAVGIPVYSLKSCGDLSGSPSMLVEQMKRCVKMVTG